MKALNLYKICKLCRSLYITDTDYNIDEEITKFTNLDDDDRQKILNIDFKKSSYNSIIKKYNRIIKNSANKTKRLIKK